MKIETRQLAEDARRQSVATALVDAVYARAKADGATRSGFIQYRKILSL